jgi:hypothetical protein
VRQGGHDPNAVVEAVFDQLIRLGAMGILSRPFASLRAGSDGEGSPD